MRDEAPFIHIDDFDISGELAGKATTHEQQRSPGSPAVQQGTPRRPLSSSLRVARDWIARIEAQMDGLFWADMVAFACICILTVSAAVFLPLFFGS